MLLLKLGALLMLASVAKADAEEDAKNYNGVITQYLYYTTQKRPPGVENQPGCYVHDLNKVIPFDREYYPDDDCALYTCEEATWNAYQFACRSVKKDCKKVIEGDDSQKYPYCCDRCDESQ